jgi:uncharacterized membrane protein
MSKFRFDPQLAWPWSLKPWGTWALLAVAVLLVALTLWTYAGVKGVTLRRLLAILGLRLLALGLACLMIVRPSFEVRELTYLPGQLLVVYDRSKSMTIKDEIGNQSRWDRMKGMFIDAKGTDSQRSRLQDLERKNVSIVEHFFDAELKPYDADATPEGPRTDIGQALHSLYASHLADKNLLGVVLVTDGADNGVRFPAITEAERFKRIPCRLYTVGVGKPTFFAGQRDLAFTNLLVEPTPVPIKGKMTVRGTLDATGFENAEVTIRLRIDDNQATEIERKETLRNRTANDIIIVTDAPAKAGEIKVTMSVDPLPGEATEANNVISTFATVTKEGISVLIVDRLRLEQKFIRRALESDPRFRVFASWRVGDAAPPGVDLFEFDKHQYDVIIIGDVSPRLFSGDDRVMEQIQQLVQEKGMGLLMMGGRDSFGGSNWANTPIGKLLPVTADEKAGDDDKKSVRMQPTPAGLQKVMLRLKEKANENAALWAKLPPLKEGVSPLGREKGEAAVLAQSPAGKPMLVYAERNEGRVLAFAADETWRWRSLGMPKTREGEEAHQRFWRQLVLFLAKQDEVDGAAWVKPETRRLPAGGRLNFTVGLRGKGGVDIKDARFTVNVMPPDVNARPIPTDTTRDGDADRGIFWKTEQPGEYKIEVVGHGRDTDGKEVTGKASARFLVYQDAVEMSRAAADHDFLDKLARAGGGKFFTAPQVDKLFDELDRQTTDHSSVRLERWPDWDREGTVSGRVDVSGFLVFTFLLFTGLLCGEWFLRRRWGLV